MAEQPVSFLKPLEDYLAKLRAARTRDKERLPHSPRLLEPPEQWNNFHLRRGDPPPGIELIQQAGLGKPRSIAEVRREIYGRILDYAVNDSKDALLVQVPAGVGKSYHAVEAVQDWAADTGARVLYTADRHDWWRDLAGFDIFEPELWYHWEPIRGDDPGPETCRYADPLITWINRGYPGIRYCLQTCAHDGWIRHCPYRLQAKRQERLIFAMHHHLVTGMSIADYDMVIVDEFPVRAFLDERRIKAADIIPPGVHGPVSELFKWLEYLVTTSQHRGKIRSKELLDIIGPDLGDVFADVELGKEVLPTVPYIGDPEDAFDVPYFYWHDLLLRLSPEYEYWKAGREDWVSRVRVLPRRWLEVLGRKHVWDNLPRKVVLLDATGTPEVYRQIFEREVETYAPNVKRQGAVIQVVGRLYGSSQVLEEKPGLGPRGGQRRVLSEHGYEMLEQCRIIAARYPGQRVGIVTFKDAVGEFAVEFGEANVVYFGALRGTNALKDVACLIIAGSYCPPTTAIQDMAAMIFPDRMEPFVTREEDGTLRFPWRPAFVEYLVRDERAWRQHSGFWADKELRAMLEQARRSELVQAIHRARPNVRECDVWVLSSVPTTEVLDAIHSDLSEAGLAPGRDKGKSIGIAWGHWLKLRGWLNERWDVGGWIDAAMLAEVAGVKVGTVRSQRWMHAIAKHDPDRWLLESRHRKGRGRPALVLQAVEVEE